MKLINFFPLFLNEIKLAQSQKASPISSIACDFESQDFCKWQQEEFDEVDWSIGTGETPSAETGPTQDHTLGQFGDNSGHYMYLEATNLNRRDIASIKSPHVVLGNYKNLCLSFWYHMKGEGIGVLATVIKQEIVWHRKNETGDNWQHAQIDLGSDLTSKPGATQIQLIAIRGMNFKSDMAIDDIKMEPGKCPEANENENNTISVRAAPVVTTPPATTTTARPVTPKNVVTPSRGKTWPKYGGKTKYGKYGGRAAPKYYRPQQRAAGKAPTKFSGPKGKGKWGKRGR